MKRKVCLFLAIAMLFALVPYASAAVDSALENDPLVQDVQQGSEYLQNLSEHENASAYLAREWNKFLVENKATAWIFKLNPLFKFLFAHEFSISWEFFTAILLWAILFGFYYPPLRMLFHADMTALATSIVIASLSVQLIGPPFISKLAEFIKNGWYLFGTIMIMIFLLILLNRVSKIVTKSWKVHLDQKRIETLESEAKKSKALREGAESMMQGARDMRKGAEKR